MTPWVRLWHRQSMSAVEALKDAESELSDLRAHVGDDPIGEEDRESKVEDLESKVDALESKVDALESKVDDLESKSNALDGQIATAEEATYQAEAASVVLSAENGRLRTPEAAAATFLASPAGQAFVSGSMDLRNALRALVLASNSIDVPQAVIDDARRALGVGSQ